jgi:hypothetical protein
VTPGNPTATTDLDQRRDPTSADVYDVEGYLACVTGSPDHVPLALRQILRGFRCGDCPAVNGLPRFDVSGAGAEWVVMMNDERVYTGEDYLLALGMLEFQLVETALNRDTGLFHLHGAALCAPLRHAGLVLAGASGVGKTTLSLALMMRGFTPFTDDIVLIDPATLHVRGLRRAFHTGADTWPLLESVAGSAVRPDIEAPPGYFVPPQWASEPVPIRWLLFPEFQPNQTPRLVPLTPAEAASRVLAQTGTLARAPRLALSTTTALIRQAECYRFITGDLSQSVAVVQQLTSQQGLTPV